jgi:hypothetical protein
VSICDWCDKPATERIEIIEPRKILGKERRFGTGRFLYACQGHKGTAETQALAFVSSTKGNLADEWKVA